MVRVVGIGRRIRIDHRLVGQQLEREHVNFFFRLLTFPDDVSRVVMGKAGLDAITGIIGQRQADGPGWRNRAVVGESDSRAR